MALPLDELFPLYPHRPRTEHFVAVQQAACDDRVAIVFRGDDVIAAGGLLGVAVDDVEDSPRLDVVLVLDEDHAHVVVGDVGGRFTGHVAPIDRVERAPAVLPVQDDQGDAVDGDEAHAGEAALVGAGDALGEVRDRLPIELALVDQHDDRSEEPVVRLGDVGRQVVLDALEIRVALHALLDAEAFPFVQLVRRPDRQDQIRDLHGRLIEGGRRASGSVIQLKCRGPTALRRAMPISRLGGRVSCSWKRRSRSPVRPT